MTATTTPDTESIGNLFWRDCLSVLDEVSFAYRVVTGSGIGEISPDHISSPVFYMTFDHDEPTGPAGVLLRPDDREDDVLPASSLEDLTAVAVARFRGEPMFEWRRWLERAKDDCFRGFYGPAVISLQTGIESFFGDLRRMMLLDAKGWAKYPPVRPLQPSFRALVQSVGGLLGAGNWDTASATPLGQYWRDLYLLRNEVIHASKRPTQDEVAAAFISHDVMRDWLRDLLLQQPRRFPRTLLAFPGARWLSSKGRETSYLRTVISRYAQPNQPYWADD